MGDYALIIFTDGHEVSPTVYLHCNGSNVPAWLEEFKTLMTGHYGGDAGYHAARFIGLCHTKIDGNLSLGCSSTKESIVDAVRAFVSSESGFEPAALEAASELDAYSHGDAGVVVVNINDMTWKAVGGYLDRHEANARLIAAAPELLDACIKARMAIGRIDPNDQSNWPLLAEALDAAIVKAKGLAA